MKVFKACLLVTKRRSITLAIYFIIFLALSILIPKLAADTGITDFADLKPNFTVINRDGETIIANGLVTYLRSRGNEVVLEDRKDVLQDATFFRATDIIVILPPGFNKHFMEGGKVVVETIVTTETAKGFYAESLVNQYLNQARLIKAAGDMDETKLISTVLNDLTRETRIGIRQFGYTSTDKSYVVYMRMLSYIVLVLVILCTGNIMTAFKRPDLMMRNLCTPIKSLKMSYQQILCNVLLSLVAWILMVSLGLILYAPFISETDFRITGLMLLNSLVVTVIALSLASLINLFINNPNTLNAVTNFGGLGLCFLGGVFVPLYFFGDGVLAVAQFTPIYWYSAALDEIYELTSFSREALAPIWQAMFTQLVFALAFFCMALVIGKHMNQSERFFNSVRTELEE